MRHLSRFTKLIPVLAVLAFGVTACADEAEQQASADPCAVHSSEDNLTDEERATRCAPPSYNNEDTDIYVARSPEPRLAPVVKDTIPSDPVQQYMMAVALFAHATSMEESEFGPNYQKVDSLERSIDLYLLAAKSMPHEVKPDLDSAVRYLSANDSLNLSVVESFLKAWDDDVEKSLIRPALEKYRRVQIRHVRSGGFDPGLRYRAGVDKNVFPACSYINENIETIYQISKRLGTSDATLWKQHWVDMITSDDECESGGSIHLDEETSLLGYNEYIAMGSHTDAQRVARGAAGYYLSNYTSGVYSDVCACVRIQPGDSTFLQSAQTWLARVSAGSKRTILIKNAQHAEYFNEYVPAQVLYQILGDSVNARRMKMKVGIKKEAP